MEIELWLAWKDPQSRQRYVIGKLWYDIEYKFKYIHSSEECAKNINNCGIDLAEKYGFRRLEPFPNIQVYSNEKLFYIFDRRLPSRKRPDFKQLVNEFGIKADCTPLELLQATGGRLATDTMEFVSPLVFSRDGAFDIDFYVTGWRHYQGETVLAELLPGTLLKLCLEPTNKYDPFAIQVLSPSQKLLGYVPVYYSRYLDEIVRSEDYEARILRIGPAENPQLRLMVKVKGRAPFLAQVAEEIKRREKKVG